MVSQNIYTESYKAFRSHTPVRTWCLPQESFNDSYWTLELCIKEAKKYQSRDAWEQGSPISYQKAIKRGWLIKCTTHIKNFRRKPATPPIWTLDECIGVGRQCKTRSEFKKRFHYPYEKARLNGWLDICCAHMG